MPKFDTASTFSLFSVDHDRVLLDSSIHSTRHLLADESTAPPKQMKFSFTLNGETKEAVLTRGKGAFSEDATMTTVNENGELEVSRVPEHFAYYSEDKNWVLTFHGDKKFDGLLFEDDNEKIHHFIGESGKLTVDGNVRSYFPGSMGRKLTTEARMAVDYWSDCHPAQSSGLGQINIGGAVGNVMIQNFGVDGSLREYNSYMVLTNQIYERQMDITIQIVDTFLATSANAAPWAPGRCSQSIQTQLENMRFWNPPSDQVLWHLLDDCFGASGGILGIAYLGVLCSANNVGVSLYSDDQYSSTQYPTWATVAHELGHNFDAQHSFEEGQGRTGGIMDYGYLSGKLIDGEVQFNTRYRESEVCREVTSAVNRGCVVKGVAPSPTGQFTIPEAEEIDNVLDAPRSDLTCVKHRLKQPTDTQVLKRFTESRTQDDCKAECAVRAECNGYVVDREGWCQLLTGATGEDLRTTPKFNTFLCAEGDLPVAFTREDVDDLLENADVTALKEECCVSAQDETFLGMNMNFEYSLNAVQCETECIQNNQCEATSFDSTGCMMYGGRDFTHTRVGRTGAVAMSCDRACISALNVAPTNTSVTETSVGGVLGGIALIAVGSAAIVAGVMYRRKKNAENNETVITAGESNVHKATL